MFVDHERPILQDCRSWASMHETSSMDEPETHLPETKCYVSTGYILVGR